MKSLLIALLICLIIPHQLKAQEIPQDYDFVGEIDLEEGRVIGDVLLYKFGEYAVIDFGYKPTTIKVYNIDTWEVVQTFNVKKWAFMHNAFFSRDESNVFYMSARGTKMYRFDIKTGEYAKVKSAKAEKHRPEDFFNCVFSSQIEHNGSVFQMCPERYIIKHDYSKASIYIFKKLLIF